MLSTVNARPQHTVRLAPKCAKSNTNNGDYAVRKLLQNGSLAHSIDVIDNGKREGESIVTDEARAPVRPLDLRREEDRLKTFTGWPVTFIDKSRMARTGLYFIGEADITRCHFCRIELGNWEEGDDPVVDHERWRPACPLLRGRAYTNIPQSSSASSEPAEGRGQDVCGLRNNVTSNGPHRPSYALESARLQSFSGWPSRMKQTPEAMADAGFFYTGSGDKTVCFYCDGGLKDWEDDDDPWEQHARWFPTCYYIRLVKGDGFVQRVNSKSERAFDSSSTDKTKVQTPEVKDVESSSVEKMPVTNSNDDSNLCKLCFSEERNTCFVPCGHVVACPKCALSVQTCPVCRKQFTSTIRLYYS